MELGRIVADDIDRYTKGYIDTIVRTGQTVGDQSNYGV